MDKFDIKSLKKNLRLKRLFQYYSEEIKMTSDSIEKYGHPEFYSFRMILKAGYPLDRDKLIKKDTKIPEYLEHLPKETALDEYQYGDWRNYIYEMDEKFFQSINQKEHSNILKDIFNGQILPKLSKNFKREIILKFQKDSYALISSKLNKKYYLFHCSRKLGGNKKKYEDLGYGDKFYYLLKIFTKKINKEQIIKIANKNNWKIIYGYVRCETKTCANKYKPLEVPKILIGKQQCQVCKNIMKKEDSKQIDAVYRLYDKSKPRVIDYVFKNFNIKKFNKIIDSYKEGWVNDFCNLILNCVDKYNPKYIRTGNEHEDDETVFLEYLGELLKTGVFFLQFKKYFKVEKYFESIVVEDTLWNMAYILLSKIDKKYRLILAHYGAHPGQDQIELISTKKKFDLNETLKELNNYNQQYHNIDKEIKLKGKGELLNAPDFKVCKPFMLIDAFHVAKNLEY